MSDETELKKIRKELEKSNKDTTERRSLLNPIFWFGLFSWIIGILLCATIIGMPLGIPMVQLGRITMYKNNTGF